MRKESEGGRDIWIAAQGRRKNSAEWKVCPLICTVKSAIDFLIDLLFRSYAFSFTFTSCVVTMSIVIGFLDFFPSSLQRKANTLKIIKMYREKTLVENVCSEI